MYTCTAETQCMRITEQDSVVNRFHYSRGRNDPDTQLIQPTSSVIHAPVHEKMVISATLEVVIFPPAICTSISKAPGMIIEHACTSA